MSLKFEEWLAVQHEREDYIGAFARGLNVDSIGEKLPRRKHNEHAIWVNIVISMGQPEYVTTFNVAWQEFLLAKEAAEEAEEALEKDIA
jgi:hypothetical protein